jgi:hypothetical protein
MKGSFEASDMQLEYRKVLFDYLAEGELVYLIHKEKHYVRSNYTWPVQPSHRG